MSRPRIVVLDGFTLNPGDLSWSTLEELGTVRVYERTAPGEVVERAAGAPLALTNKTALGAAVLEQLPELRYIGVLATGTNVVDLATARARGIVVTNVPSYGADSVAEHTLGLLLEASKHLAQHARAVREGGWARQPDFSFSVAPIRLLAGRTLGIIGLGAIGGRVAELASAFRMKVLAVRRSGSRPGAPAAAAQATWCELDELLARSDFVSLHCPLTSQTRHLIDAQRLGQMQPSAALINTARGGLIDEAALAAALRSGQIAAAYLDVLDTEPPPAGHPLVALPNCWVTPHIAWASREARARLMEIAVENVRAFLAGRPEHVVT